jgi:hypothetical protein
VGQILVHLGLQSRVQVAMWMATRQHTSQLESVMAVLERLREVSRTDLGGALQHVANVLAPVFLADKV